MRALISVYNKDGIIDFVRKLTELNIEIISTGGTGKLLSENGIPFIPVENITKNKEAFGGRMKTISFEMISSILYNRNSPSDQSERIAMNLSPIDIVVCNLYNFKSSIKPNTEIQEMTELIDIGGPTMIRAAAKNFTDVACITDPLDYQKVADELLKNGQVSNTTKRLLASKAFTLTANYDHLVALELTKKITNELHIEFSSDKQKLRYGENPHQNAELYVFNNTDQFSTLATSEVMSGKELSYNNFLDCDVAYKIISELRNVFSSKYSTAIIKHGIPCGVSTSDHLFSSCEKAWNSDAKSAFGSVIAFSHEVDLAVANFFSDKFVEVIMAPNFSEAALEKLKKKKNLRLLKTVYKESLTKEKTIRSINGGILVQDEDHLNISDIVLTQATNRKFENIPNELIKFGQIVVKYLKSNCLVLVNNDDIESFAITASGVGQPNRIDCLTMLINQKTEGIDIKNHILFSDAFFPFSDSIISAGKSGVNFIVQPGGSINDADVIKTCNDLNIAMMLTGTRNFRH